MSDPRRDNEEREPDSREPRAVQEVRERIKKIDDQFIHLNQLQRGLVSREIDPLKEKLEKVKHMAEAEEATRELKEIEEKLEVVEGMVRDGLNAIREALAREKREIRVKNKEVARANEEDRKAVCRGETLASEDDEEEFRRITKGKTGKMMTRTRDPDIRVADRDHSDIRLARQQKEAERVASVSIGPTDTDGGVGDITSSDKLKASGKADLASLTPKDIDRMVSAAFGKDVETSQISIDDITVGDKGQYRTKSGNVDEHEIVGFSRNDKKNPQKITDIRIRKVGAKGDGFAVSVAEFQKRFTPTETQKDKDTKAEKAFFERADVRQFFDRISIVRSYDSGLYTQIESHIRDLVRQGKVRQVESRMAAFLRSWDRMTQDSVLLDLIVRYDRAKDRRHKGIRGLLTTELLQRFYPFDTPATFDPKTTRDDILEDLEGLVKAEEKKAVKERGLFYDFPEPTDEERAALLKELKEGKIQFPAVTPIVSREKEEEGEEIEEIKGERGGTRRKRVPYDAAYVQRKEAEGSGEVGFETRKIERPEDTSEFGMMKKYLDEQGILHDSQIKRDFARRIAAVPSEDRLAEIKHQITFLYRMAQAHTPIEKLRELMATEQLDTDVHEVDEDMILGEAVPPPLPEDVIQPVEENLQTIVEPLKQNPEISGMLQRLLNVANTYGEDVKTVMTEVNNMFADFLTQDSNTAIEEAKQYLADRIAQYETITVAPELPDNMVSEAMMGGREEDHTRTRIRLKSAGKGIVIYSGETPFEPSLKPERRLTSTEPSKIQEKKETEGDVLDTEELPDEEPIKVEAIPETKAARGKVEVLPNELLEMIGEQAFERVTSAILVELTSEHSAPSSAVEQLRNIFDGDHNQEALQAFVARLKSSGRIQGTQDFSDWFRTFQEEWEKTTYMEVYRSLFYHILTLVEEQAARIDTKTQTRRSAKEEQRMSTSKKVGRFVQRAILPTLAATGAGLATGGFGPTALAASFATYKWVDRLVERTIFKRKSSLDREFEQARQIASIETAGQEVQKVLHGQQAAELAAMHVAAGIGGIPKDIQEQYLAVLEQIANARESDPESTMRYALEALRQRNDTLRTTAFTEKVQGTSWWGKLWTEFKAAVKRGEVKGLWQQDEHVLKRILGDVIESSIAGAVGATIGLAGGNVVVKAAARGGTGFAKGFLRKFFRGKADTQETHRQEVIVEAKADVTAAIKKFRDLQKRARGADDDAIGLLDEAATILARLKSYRDTKGLLHAEPALAESITILISQYELLFNNINRQTLKTGGDAKTLADAIQRLKRESVISSRQTRDALEQRLTGVTKKEQARQLQQALASGAKEGSIVAVVGGAFDFLRSDAFRGVLDSVRQLFHKAEVSPHVEPPDSPAESAGTPGEQPQATIPREAEGEIKNEARYPLEEESAQIPQIERRDAEETWAEGYGRGEPEPTPLPVEPLAEAVPTPEISEEIPAMTIQSGDNPWNLIRQMLSERYGEAFNHLPAGSKNYVVDLLKDQYEALKQAGEVKDNVVEDGRFWPGKWFNVNPLVSRAGGWSAVEDAMALVDPDDPNHDESLIQQLERSRAARSK